LFIFIGPQKQQKSSVFCAVCAEGIQISRSSCDYVLQVLGASKIETISPAELRLEEDCNCDVQEQLKSTATSFLQRGHPTLINPELSKDSSKEK
jgi:hypothetical protein